MDWDDARELLGVAKELGSNFVRLSHYPHNERTLRIADELGLLVWSEIPVYWEEIRYNEPYTKAVAKRMYKDSLNRDYNRASVVIWGVANETPITDSRNVFLKMLIDYVRSMDSTRLISAALNKKTNRGDTFIIEDPLGEHLDVISVNEYEGWYGNRTLDDVPGLIWETPYDKPMLFSEFGAGALLGARGGRLERFTEEHQAAFYEVTLEMAEQIPFLRGISPWILKDFRSPRRWHGRYQEYWNRKGLIAETGEKKPAFDVLQEWYESYDGPVTD
jgi:beta-glucuronidase